MDTATCSGWCHDGKIPCGGKSCLVGPGPAVVCQMLATGVELSEESWTRDIKMYRYETRPRPSVQHHHPACRAGKTDPIQTKQLRRLQALWRRWSGSLGLLPEADRRLRHYYIQLITQGRASETRELGETDAGQMIQWLGEQVRRAEAPQRYAAGTAGRKGYPEQRQVQPSSAAWRALWSCAETLGMDRPDLERFVRRHYARTGLKNARKGALGKIEGYLRA